MGELERLTRENAMLRLAVQEMPHGLSVFDGDDKLVFANRHLAKVWGLPDGLLQPGTSLAPAWHQLSACHRRLSLYRNRAKSPATRP